MNKLELKKINKHYGKKKHALCDFSFDFTNGIYGLLGPNGAGKSTLMNIITDNLRPDKDGGKILWNGEETRILKDKFRSQMGFMPQQQNLYESMTARMFLNYIAALKCLDKKNAENEISEIIEIGYGYLSNVITEIKNYYIHYFNSDIICFNKFGNLFSK